MCLAGPKPSEYAPASLAERMVFHQGGRYVTADEWPKYGGNPFPEAPKNVMPWSFSLPALAAHNPLTELDDWLSPEAQPLALLPPKRLPQSKYSVGRKSITQEVPGRLGRQGRSVLSPTKLDDATDAYISAVNIRRDWI